MGPQLNVKSFSRFQFRWDEFGVQRDNISAQFNGIVCQTLAQFNANRGNNTKWHHARLINQIKSETNIRILFKKWRFRSKRCDFYATMYVRFHWSSYDRTNRYKNHNHQNDIRFTHIFHTFVAQLRKWRSIFYIFVNVVARKAK